MSNRIFNYLLAIAGFLTISVHVTGQPAGGEPISKSAQAARSGDYAAALVLARQAIANDSSIAQNYYQLGLVLQAMGRHAEALPAHSRALNISPGKKEQLLARANTWQALDQYDSALADLAKAEKAGLRKGELANARALALAGKGNSTAAAQQWDLAIKTDPTYYDTYWNLGHYYFRQQQWAKAENAFTKYLPNATEKASVYLYRAQCRLQQQEAVQKNRKEKNLLYTDQMMKWDDLKWQDINSDFNACLALDPSNYDAKLTLARLGARTVTLTKDYPNNPVVWLQSAREAFEVVRYQFGSPDISKPLEYVNKAIALYPAYAEAYAFRASLYPMKDYRKAIVDYTRAIELDPDGAAWYWYDQRGLAYYHTDQMEKSLADKDQANRLCELQQGDRFQMALYNPAYKINRTGHQWLNDAYNAFTPEDKLHRLNKAVETDPSISEAWAMRGDIYSARGNKTQAASDYEKAAQASPKDGAYQRKAALYFFSQKNYSKAVEYYTRLLAINPRDTDAYKDRAYALVQLGRTNEANADLAKVQAIDPNDTYAKTTLSANQYNQQAIAYKQEQDKKAAQQAAASNNGQNNTNGAKAMCTQCKGAGVITIPGTCKECKGKGSRIYKPDHCGKCGGSGYYGVVRDWSALNQPVISNHVSVLCEVCYGIRQKCVPCGGKGGNARAYCKQCKGTGML